MLCLPMGDLEGLAVLFVLNVPPPPNLGELEDIRNYWLVGEIPDNSIPSLPVCCLETLLTLSESFFSGSCLASLSNSPYVY